MLDFRETPTVEIINIMYSVMNTMYKDTNTFWEIPLHSYQEIREVCFLPEMISHVAPYNCLEH